MERKLLEAFVSQKLTESAGNVRDFAEANGIDAKKAVLLFLDLVEKSCAKLRVEIEK